MKSRLNKFGFTLIEIIVVVSSVGVVMLVVTGSLLQIMKVQNQSEAISRLSTSGNRILGELRRNLFNSDGEVVCGTNHLSVGFTNVTDGLGTIISCVTGDKIASTSGSIERKLNENIVSITSCSNFVSCNSGSVTFNFGIGTSVAGVGVTRNFTTTVTIRN